MKIEDALKIKKFSSPVQKASISIIYTGHWLTDVTNTLLKPYDLSEQQFNVLRILRGQKKGPVSLSVIQERMLHRMSNATRLVEKLRIKGYVSREICDENRRKVDICITTKGLKILEMIDDLMIRMDQKTGKKITKEEAETLCMILDKIRS
jgi:DNA-binding MarR family transcriptional regulator